MPTEMRVLIGEVLVYDGTNAEELATLVGAADVPEPAEDGSIVLSVPMLAGAMDVTLAPGDGLVIRDVGFLTATAENLEQFPLEEKTA